MVSGAKAIIAIAAAAAAAQFFVLSFSDRPFANCFFPRLPQRSSIRKLQGAAEKTPR